MKRKLPAIVVLKTIHESYKYIDVTPNIILQLHHNLYRHTASSMGGHFKIGDNEIHDIRNDGTEYARFKTVPAVSTPDAMERLCAAFREGFGTGALDPLLISLEFVFDFTCIHPFNDGNGRISRLLTLLLLYKSGYKIGKYISLEKEIERTKGDYYDALAISSRGWENGTNDPGPFVRYMLGVILATYRDFEDRAVTVSAAKLTKAERVENVLRNGIGKITKSEITDACPGISITTIERVLSALLKTEKIRKVGGDRKLATVWVVPRNSTIMRRILADELRLLSHAGDKVSCKCIAFRPIRRPGDEALRPRRKQGDGHREAGVLRRRRHGRHHDQDSGEPARLGQGGCHLSLIHI